MAVRIKITVFWDVTMSSNGLKEPKTTSEEKTKDGFYRTTRHTFHNTIITTYAISYFITFTIMFVV
jgi:hypothetical protein